MHAADPVTNVNRSSPLLWAAFLGASWTWVIGMFLPTLLIRDFGPWSWVIFAAPNVIGAAAMGWAMRSRAHSESFVARHAGACRLFSLVTIAFHLYFALWALPAMIGPVGWAVALVAVQIAFTPIRGSRFSLGWSVVTLLASLAAAAVMHRQGVLVMPEPKAFPMPDVLGLVAVCLAGFLVCPYFDLTFQRARQQTTDGGAKIAFGVGFGVMFCSMIVLTFFYATKVNFLTPGSTAAWAIGAHWSLQILLTVCLHAASLQALPQAADDDRASWRPALGFAMAAALLAAMFVRFADSVGWKYGGMAVGEVIYRCFMAFYGLVIPAYFATNYNAHRRRRTKTWLLAMLVALPFYWIAFMHKSMGYFIPGVALLILFGIFVSFVKSPATAGPSEQTPPPHE